MFIIIIIIIIYLPWSWATCLPVPVSRIQKYLQRSAMISSATWGVVFHLLWVIYFEAFYLPCILNNKCLLYTKICTK